MEWDRLKTFYYVGKNLSFKKGADIMGIAQSSLSRSISLLEHQLKTTLFIRNTTGIVFTNSGNKLFKIAEEMYDNTEKIKHEIWEENNIPQGEILITAIQGIVNHYLTLFLPDFQKLYPNIILKISAKDNIPEFEYGVADIAICPPDPHRKDLVQKLLITGNVILVASPQYLQEYGIPLTPEDLDHHKLIGIGDLPEFSSMNWHLSLGTKDGNNRLPVICISSPQSRLFLAEQGLGITAISKEHPGLEQMNLVQVLPHIKGPTGEFSIMYPKYLSSSKRIQTFVNYIIPCFQNTYKLKE